MDVNISRNNVVTTPQSPPVAAPPAPSRAESAPAPAAQPQYTQQTQAQSTHTVEFAIGGNQGLFDESAEVSGAEEAITERSVERATIEINDMMQQLNLNRRLEHSVHEATNTIVVRVINSDTNEVVRELPAEDRLDALYKLKQSLGINIDSLI